MAPPTDSSARAANSAPNNSMPNVTPNAGTENEHALVPTSSAPQATDPVREKRFQAGSPFACLPVELSVVVPVRNFRVKNLLSLDTGQVVESYWNHGEDLPLSSGDVQLAWSEFEVVDTHLAVRVTRLS